MRRVLSSIDRTPKMRSETTRRMKGEADNGSWANQQKWSRSSTVIAHWGEKTTKEDPRNRRYQKVREQTQVVSVIERTRPLRRENHQRGCKKKNIFEVQKTNKSGRRHRQRTPMEARKPLLNVMVRKKETYLRKQTYIYIVITWHSHATLVFFNRSDFCVQWRTAASFRRSL